MMDGLLLGLGAALSFQNLLMVVAGEYEFGRALGLLATMVVYALAIFPIGFVISTTAFLVASATILGERRYVILVPVSLAAALIVWFLVQEVLGVFLRPWPSVLIS